MYHNGWLTPVAWLGFLVGLLLIVGLIFWRPEALRAWFGHDKEKPIDTVRRQQAREAADKAEVAADEAESRYQEIDEEVNAHAPQITRLLADPKVMKNPGVAKAQVYDNWRSARRGSDDEKELGELRAARRYLKMAQQSLAADGKADEWMTIIVDAIAAATKVNSKAAAREAAFKMLLADLTADGESDRKK